MALFAVSAAIERTGALEPLRRAILARGDMARAPLHELLLRFVPGVLLASSFLNNTPIAALLVPVVKDLSAKARLKPSRMLITLGYASILGGTTTLIGTSTNLLLASLASSTVLEETGEDFRIGFFEVGQVGLPVALIGMLFLMLFSGPALPDREPDGAAARAVARGTSRGREYAVAVFVPKGSTAVGKTMGDAGLCSLPGIRVYRRLRPDGVTEEPDQEREILREQDIICLAGPVDRVIDLLRVRSVSLVESHHHLALVPAKALSRKAHKQNTPAADSHPPDVSSSASASTSIDSAPADAPPPRAKRRNTAARLASAIRPLWNVADTRLAELVVGQGDLVGRTVREVRFAERFGAAILAVQRRGDGTSVVPNMGDLRLRAGDGLLVACPPGFVEEHLYDPAFALVADVSNYSPMRSSRAVVAMVLTAAMLAAAIAGFSLLTAALVVIGLMITLRCLTVEEARKSFDVSIFLVFGAAFGLARGFVNSGAASLVANAVLSAAGEDLTFVILLLHVTTAVLTEVVTNGAAVSLGFGIAYEVHRVSGLPLRPMVLTLMMAASSSYITPTGYPVNTLIYK